MATAKEGSKEGSGQEGNQECAGKKSEKLAPAKRPREAGPYQEGPCKKAPPEAYPERSVHEGDDASASLAAVIATSDATHRGNEEGLGLSRGTACKTCPADNDQCRREAQGASR